MYGAMGIALSSCSFDLAVLPAITSEQVMRKVSVQGESELIIEEGVEYEVSLNVETPYVPNLQYKSTTLSWEIQDPQGDFENSSGTIEVGSELSTVAKIRIKALKDAEIESDEHFSLIFTGTRFEGLENTNISLTVLDRTTRAKVEPSLAEVNFGAQLINGSQDRTLTFTNTGDAPAQNLIWSTPMAPFSYKGGSFPGLGGTCANSLTGSSSCTVILSYSSATAASHSQAFTWNYTNPDLTDNGALDLKGLSVEVTAILGSTPPERSHSENLNVSVSGIDITHYRYKLGPVASTNCSVASGYTSDLGIAQPITNSLTTWANQNLRLCVIGQESHGIWQPYSQATFHDWFYDNTIPTLTINQKSGQADPARTLPVEFTVTFSEEISGFSTTHIQQTGTATGVVWNLTTSDSITWTLQATAVSTDGTIMPSVSAGAVTDLAGNENTLSTSTDNSVLYDSIRPSLTINQRAGQSDPTNALPILFTAVFSEPINPASFDTSDITTSGTALGLAWTLSTTDNKTWTLSAISATGDGTIVPSIQANAVTDLSGNLNFLSTSTDNSVTYSTSAPNNASSLAWQQNSPTNTTSLVAEWVKSVSTLSSQSVQFYTGTNCDVALGSPHDAGVSGTTYPLTGVSGTTYSYIITSVDLATNSVDSSCSAPLTVDTTVPTITNITSTKTNGAYKAGSVIDIQIEFSEDVTVMGTPSLALNTTPARSATYNSGSGTSTLNFTYTVQATDAAADLNYMATNSLSVASASIRDEAGNNAGLTLPGLAAVGSLGTNKNIVIDTVAPTIDIFSVSNTSPTNSTTYSITSAVSGSPTDYCILENSTLSSNCVWTSGAALPASFVVSATNNSKTLYAWVRDAAGNTSAMSASNAVVLDTLAPTLALSGFPTGSSAKYNLTITPSGTDIVSYRYKLGVTGSTDCSSVTDYSTETLISTPIVENISSLANGGITLCAVGKDTAGNWQALASATVKTWTKATPVLQFTLTSSSISEYDSPSHTVQVSIPSAVDINVSASYNFSAGPTFPATNGVDYDGTSGTVTILAGNTTANIIIPIIDDLRYENNETFYVNLTAATGATLGSQVQNLVTITDDDDPPLISIQDVYVIEGTSTSLRASLSAISDKGNITLNWDLDSCTGSDCANSPADYTMPATSGSAVITQGSSYVDFGLVNTVDNATDETHRRIPIKITSVTGGTLLAGKAEVIINDNDYAAGKDAVKIATNYENVCAIAGNQKLYCWGANNQAQLGQGDTETREGTVEVVIGASQPITNIVGAFNRFCALTVAGQVYCWGYGGSASGSGTGLIGDNSSSTRFSPTLISTLGSGVSEIAVSGYNTCALKSGAVYCWGSNHNGIVGGTRTDPAVVTKVPVAMPAPLNAGVSKISMGAAHACALISGEVYCWGNNNNGELGRGNTNSASNPQITAAKAIGLGNDIIDIWAGYYGTCAKNSSDEVYCWGRNNEKQLPESVTYLSTPTRIPDFDQADKIIVQRTLCLLKNGELRCRGNNQYGSIGHNEAGGAEVLNLTIPVGGAASVTDVAVGADNTYTCFIRSGQPYCTGFGGSGNLGDGYIRAFATPQLATNISGVNGASKISQGTNHACGLFSGAVKCWGWNVYNRAGNQSPETIYMEPTPVKGLTAGYIDIVATGSGTCALHSSGEVKCWGYNSIRGIGASTFGGNPSTPTGLDSGVTAIMGGSSSTSICALKNNQTYCWGTNDYGALGTGNVTHQTSPYLVPEGADVIAVGFASYTTCLVKSTGKVLCSGSNAYGSLGMGDTTPRYTFTEVPTLSNITQIGAIAGGFCAIRNDGTVWCWGRVLADGNSSNRSTPTEMTALPNTTKIVGTTDNYCAKTNGIWKCWGMNMYGQMGDGTMSPTYSYTPTTSQFANLGTISDWVMASWRTCVKVGSDYYCAGGDKYSEFARNNKPYRIAPISTRPFP
ncbi:Regulator of chromosome condensation (RCC1) repeat protein [compost metagenome]